MTQPANWDRDPDSARRARYLEPARPLVFPESAEVPESQLHLDLRTLLYLLLSDHLGEGFTVGSDQFVYWDAGNPQRCLAPDVYVKRAPRGAPVRSWKVWERGAPDIGIEIVSDSDEAGDDRALKLKQYQAIGVQELVRFDPQSETGSLLRVWDRVDGRLRERALDGDQARSLVLGLHWVVAPERRLGKALRIATSVEPLALVPTHDEARRSADEARRSADEARRTAEARVRELEALLAERDRGE